MKRSSWFAVISKIQITVLSAGDRFIEEDFRKAIGLSFPAVSHG